jgi:hypothetical protein
MQGRGCKRRIGGGILLPFPINSSSFSASASLSPECVVRDEDAEEDEEDGKSLSCNKPDISDMFSA